MFLIHIVYKLQWNNSRILYSSLFFLDPFPQNPFIHYVFHSFYHPLSVLSTFFLLIPFKKKFSLSSLSSLSFPLLVYARMCTGKCGIKKQKDMEKKKKKLGKRVYTCVYALVYTSIPNFFTYSPYTHRYIHICTHAYIHM